MEQSPVGPIGLAVGPADPLVHGQKYKFTVVCYTGLVYACLQEFFVAINPDLLLSLISCSMM